MHQTAGRMPDGSELKRFTEALFWSALSRTNTILLRWETSKVNTSLVCTPTCHCLSGLKHHKHKMLQLLPVLLFLLPPTLSLSPGDVLPSCLEKSITWDPSTITGITIGVQNPEECQKLCLADAYCSAVTWSTEAAELFPLACAFFSVTSDQTEPCSHCVSGPPVCACNVPGECEVVGENIIKVIVAVASVSECQLLCLDNHRCKVFTFLGEENDFRCINTSFKLL